MDVQDYLMKMKHIQKYILKIINEDDEQIFEKTNAKLIIQMQDEFINLKPILYLIAKISNNHFRKLNFIDKICQIILLLKDKIRANLSNIDIFNIFKGNKRIILFLIKEKILNLDNYLASIIISDKYKKYRYIEYLAPEVKQFMKKTECDQFSSEFLTDFEENRQIGQNDSYICELIRDDSVEDFITYVNKNTIPLESKIKSSIFETNHFLIKNQPNLIEYSAFFGSIQIFNYLLINKVELTPSLWLYAIHGSSAEIIFILEENNILPKDTSFIKCFKESIKCHHNDIANYINQNFLIEQNIKEVFFDTIHYHNFFFFPEEIDQKPIFFYACEYDCLEIVKYFLNNKKIDINDTIIVNVDEIIL